MISGGGSGLRALLKYQQEADRAHVTTLVIADSESAGGLKHAMDAGVDFVAVPLPQGLKGNERRRAHEEQIMRIIESNDIELVVLSGYMRILTPSFVSHWKGRLVNIHPSLLPDFPGAHAQRDALEARVRVSGCTVHFVDEGVDSGPIIQQRKVPVLESDTIDTLRDRIKEAEHDLYPKVLDDLSSGRIFL
tara:strand:- start:891 stop:1463 length:573 start_codon:yes stop_codon:yes gene_type:complete